MSLRSIILGACVAVMASVAVAEAAPVTEDERLLYAVRFRGLRVGDLVIGLNQTSTDYRTEMRAHARGIAKLFNNFRAELEGEGRVAPQSAARVAPDVYRRAWGASRWAALMTVAFDPATGEAVPKERFFNPQTGTDLKREDLPGRRRKPSPPVDAQDRYGVLDPMSAFITGRRIMRDQWRQGEYARTPLRLKVYDGARRYDVVITPEPVADMEIGGTVYRVVPASTRLEPVGGFDAKMAKRAREGKGRIAFSANDRFLPLQINMGNSLGRGVFTLVADCKTTPAACESFDAQKPQKPTASSGSTVPDS